MYCVFFSNSARFLVMIKVPSSFYFSISKRYFLRNWAWCIHPTFFVFRFSSDSSCVAPFLAMRMHSCDWLGTELFPEDTKTDSISSFSENCFSFRRKKRTRSRLNKRFVCGHAWGTGLLSRMMVFPENCCSEQNVVFSEHLLRLLRAVGLFEQ